MTKHSKWFLVLMACLAVGIASEASAATSWKRLGANPFYRPALSSEADLRNLVKTRSADLKAGFAKAGYPGLYPAFMEQFPAAKIDSVTVGHGETFAWIVFKKKSTGQVSVLKDATWRGPVAFEAFRFTIDNGGKRHEFVVPYACGNVALRNMTPIPPPSLAVSAPAPAIAAPAPEQGPGSGLGSGQGPDSGQGQAASRGPSSEASTPMAVAAPQPDPAVPAKSTLPPVAPKPAAADVSPSSLTAPPPPPPAAPWLGGLLFDVGLSRQFDPANYLFARVGYELPLTDKLYLVGFLGGSLRWMGNDGGNAFTADLMLDYHWMGRHSVGLGAGFWSGNDGQVDLIADVGYLLFGPPDGSNGSLFLEARLPADELDSVNEFGRVGLGLRFRL